MPHTFYNTVQWGVGWSVGVSPFDVYFQSRDFDGGSDLHTGISTSKGMNPWLITHHFLQCQFTKRGIHNRMLCFHNGFWSVFCARALSLLVGVVFNYTKTGVCRDHQGWERCLSIPLVQPDMYNLIDQWDQYLDKFSTAQMWDTVWKRYTGCFYNLCLRSPAYRVHVW